MPDLNRYTVAFIAAAVPYSFFLFVLWRDTKKRRETSRAPFTRMMLRPPGESLRQRLIQIDDRVTENIAGLMISCAAIGIGVYVLYTATAEGLVLTLAGLGLFTWCAIRLMQLLPLRRNYHLGFVGERFVGEELNQMLAHGWKVFHDVEFNDNPSAKPFNVDHVVVGVGGVYAVETKTRRKPVRLDRTDPENKAIYDGETIRFPWGDENFGIAQARDRARHIEKWLSSSLKIEIKVVPVLALPGWSVKRIGKTDVLVVSGAEVGSILKGENQKGRQDQQLVNSICALLDERCRDVGKEFKV